MQPAVVLSLFDLSGVWSQPYVDAGCQVVRVDIAYLAGEHRVAGNLVHIGTDILDFDISYRPNAVLAAPDCSCFCRPAARWWKRQDAEGKTETAIKNMRAALRLCHLATGWWALENPPGRHQRLIPELGKPSWQFHPYEYGDPWAKQTYIWGTAQKPVRRNVVKPATTRRTPNGKTTSVF